MRITNAIKLPAGETPAKAVVAIRKTTGLSIAEIKDRVSKSEPIIDSDLSDDESLGAIIGLYSEMKGLGIESKLYQGGREVSIEFMENVLFSHRKTAKEVGLD